MTLAFRRAASICLAGCHVADAPSSSTGGTRRASREALSVDDALAERDPSLVQFAAAVSRLARDFLRGRRGGSPSRPRRWPPSGHPRHGGIADLRSWPGPRCRDRSCPTSRGLPSTAGNVATSATDPKRRCSTGWSPSTSRRSSLNPARSTIARSRRTSSASYAPTCAAGSWRTDSDAPNVARVTARSSWPFRAR